MRIANKSSLTGIVPSLARGLLWVALGLATPLTAAWADNAPLPIPPAPAPIAPGAMPVAMLPPGAAAPLPAAPALLPPGGAADMTKNIATLEEKATDGAKAALKNLDGTEPLTLDDLNRARQTVARIDAMIDIEKRLGELEKLREAKNGGGSSNFAGAIPASALTPFGGNKGFPKMPAFPSAQEIPVVMHVAPAKPEISRIIGADGKYEAVLKMSDGEMRSVRVGDTVSGGTVRWITASAIGLDEKGHTEIIHVKNVDIVTSAIR